MTGERRSRIPERPYRAVLSAECSGWLKAKNAEKPWQGRCIRNARLGSPTVRVCERKRQGGRERERKNEGNERQREREREERGREAGREGVKKTVWKFFQPGV